jgi:hypothetical protein
VSTILGLVAKKLRFSAQNADEKESRKDLVAKKLRFPAQSADEKESRR